MKKNAKNGSVRVGDAVMHYVSFGTGSRCMVVLPGLSDGLATVKGKAFLLAPPYRIFLEKYTVYMFSRKEPLTEGCSVLEMADDQAAALHSLGIGKIFLVGVSQGGMIAQALAARHPELVEKLVIAVSAPSVNETIRTCVEKWIGYAEERDHRQLMIDTAKKSYSESYLRKYRKMLPLLGFVGRPKSYDRFLVNARAILGFDMRDELHRILCPVLIIGGEKDQIVGVQASQKMHEAIAGSILHIYPELGHAAYEEAGKDFYERIFRFFES